MSETIQFPIPHPVTNHSIIHLTTVAYWRLPRPTAFLYTELFSSSRCHSGYSNSNFQACSCAVSCHVFMKLFMNK